VSKVAWLLLHQQSPFLIAAAVACFLDHLRAGGGAATRICEHQAAVPVDERPP